MSKWFAVLVLVGGLAGAPARAADHLDGPAVKADASTDITDLYAWMSADGAKAYLVMNILGAPTGASSTTKFSNSAIYTFHIDSGAKFGAAAGATSESLIMCTFSADTVQVASCWAPGSTYVTGDASAVAGIASSNGKLKVFAGLRDDPFFFNLRGFKALASFVHGAAGVLMFDPAGCPKLDAATSMVAVQTLKGDGAMGPGVDDFSAKGPLMLSGNVLSIVVAVDAALITPKGKVFSVWASTNKK